MLKAELGFVKILTGIYQEVQWLGYLLNNRAVAVDVPVGAREVQAGCDAQAVS
jgi:hypothetical protein